MAAKPPSAGYSGKPLPEKLGFRPGMVAAFIALPKEHTALPDSVTFAKVLRCDWKRKLAAQSFDLIHAFTARRADLAANLARLEKALKRTA